MKLLISTFLILCSFSVFASRKGPIFKIEEIPSQRSLLLKYVNFNSHHMVANNSRLLKFERLYKELTPEDFLVFKSRQARHTPNLEFSLAFQNHNMARFL